MIQENQRTIARPAETKGVGLHSGAETTVRFVPAPPGSGVRFVRTDVPGRPVIPARIDYALEDGADPRRTTLNSGDVKIGTVEHVLAAVSGLGIDNLDIEISAAEPCEPDGSSRPFLEILHERCIQCAACVAVCGPEALLLRDNRLVFVTENCTRCVDCFRACPSAALSPTGGRYYREKR